MRHRQRREQARARSCRPGVPRNHDPVEKAQRVEHLDRRKRRLVAALRLVERGSGGAAATRAARAGVLVSAFGPRTLRAVTHLDVSRADCERAADRLVQLLKKARPRSRAPLSRRSTTSSRRRRSSIQSRSSISRACRRNFARSQNGRSRCDKSPIAADGFRKSGGPPRRSPRSAQSVRTQIGVFRHEKMSSSEAVRVSRRAPFETPPAASPQDRRRSSA